jgi:hypothetical protein
VAFEYPAEGSVIRLTKKSRLWGVEFNGRRVGNWASPEAAAIAVAHHASGLLEWDRAGSYAPHDILDWRPLGDSL